MENFTGSFTALGNLAYGGAQVSANVVDLRSGLTLLSIDERMTGKYLDTMLGQLIKLGERFPDASPEALVEVMTGESEFPDTE